MTKSFAHFSSYYRVWQTTGNKLKGPTSYSDNYCGTFTSIFLATKKLLKTQVFDKKLSFMRKKFCRLFFLVLSSVSNLSGKFLRVQKVFWQLLWKL